MDHSRRFKPFWRWEIFLFALVLVLSMLASVVVRVDWGVAGGVLTVLLLVLGVVVALVLVVPLFRRSGRDSEGSRHTLEGVELVALPEAQGRRIRLEEVDRRRTSIDAALALSAGAPRGVLTPDASRWLGRELRVAVDLVDDRGGIHRAGFLPRDIGAEFDPGLRELAAAGRAAEVSVSVTGVQHPFTVEVEA